MMHAICGLMKSKMAADGHLGCTQMAITSQPVCRSTWCLVLGLGFRLSLDFYHRGLHIRFALLSRVTLASAGLSYLSTQPTYVGRIRRKNWLWLSQCDDGWRCVMSNFPAVYATGPTTTTGDVSVTRRPDVINHWPNIIMGCLLCSHCVYKMRRLR